MNVAVIFAGGIGSRMRSGGRAGSGTSKPLPKQFLEIHGTPLIVHTIQHFQEHSEIDGVAVAMLPEWRDHFMRLVTRYELTKVQWVIDGGETGQQSRHRALRAVAAGSPDDTVVLIHDGVRPLIDDELISANIRTAREQGPAITCTKFTETIVKSADELIDEVVPRDELYVAQAPQSLLLGDAMAIYDHAVADGEENSIDTCSLLHRYGYPIHRVDGPRSNIKITTAEDYYVCRAFFDVLETRQVGL